MALKSIQTHVSDGTLQSVQFNINFLNTSHLHFYVDDVEITASTPSQGVAVDGVDEYGVTLTAAVPSGAVFKVQRQTPRDNVPHVFATGAALFTALTTDANNEYLLYVVQETYEQSGQGPFPTITTLVGTEYVVVETGGVRKQITAQDFLASVPGVPQLLADLANTADPAKGAGMVGFAGQTLYDRISQWKSLTDAPWSAKFDGVTDDTAALNAAFASGHKYWLAPEGDCLILGNVYFDGDEGTGGIYLKGQGVGKTHFLCTAVSNGTGSNTARGGTVTDSYEVDSPFILRHPDGGYNYHTKFEDFSIMCSGVNRDIAIYHPRATHFAMNRVSTFGFKTGQKTFDTWLASFDHVIHNGTGVSSDWNGFLWALDSASGPTGTTCKFSNCWARDGIGIGWHMQGLWYSGMSNCGADNITGRAYEFATSQISMNACGAENNTLTANGYLYNFMNSQVSMTACRSYKIMGATDAAFMGIDDGRVVIETCQFDNFDTVGGAYNLVIKSGGILITDGSKYPTNGNSFNPLSGGAKIVNTGEGSVTKVTGKRYPITSNTADLRHEVVGKTIPSSGSVVATVKAAPVMSSYFVKMRVSLHDASFLNGASFSEVLIALHYEGDGTTYRQSVPTVTSATASSGTLVPGYSITRSGDTWSIVVTPVAGDCTCNIVAEFNQVGTSSGGFTMD